MLLIVIVIFLCKLLKKYANEIKKSGVINSLLKYMKLFSFVVTPYLISGRKLKGVIRLRAYQNIEYHRYHDDITLFIGTQNRGLETPFLT